MERVVIIGSNGAGKSTFSYALADKTGLPLIHLDQIYWHDDWQVTPREEFARCSGLSFRPINVFGIS